MTTRSTTLAAALAGVLLLGGQAHASPVTDASLRACAEASRLTGASRGARLREGLALAERALVTDPADARAYLAVFCNLGRLTQDEGLGLSAVGAVRRLARMIDDAARLAPDDPDVLAARGAFLLELPRVFGGDPTTGESLLRRALVLAPSHCEAASRLARALEASGRVAEAAALPHHC